MTDSSNNHGGVPRQLLVSAHAVERFQQRVARDDTSAQAREALKQMVLAGTLRPRPRHWTRNVAHTPGLRFLYWAELPNVCALVLDGVVVTLVTRETCRTSARRGCNRGGPDRRYERIARRRRLAELRATSAGWAA
jgi:hypothetical protein